MSVQPAFLPAPASFVVKLPNLNERVLVIQDSEMSDEEKIIALFDTRKYVTRKDVERVLQSSSFPATNMLNKLLNDGRIVRVGSARATKYKSR